MSAVNRLVGSLLDALLGPLEGVPAEVGLLLWSLVIAVLMLLVVKRTTNQAALAAVKRRIHASMFEIRLLNDDLGAILRAQLELLRHNGRYLLLSLPPLAVMIVPLVLLIGHLHGFYGFRPLEPGDEVLVRVALAGGHDATTGRPHLDLELPAGLEAVTPAVWSPRLHEVAWRVRADRPGRYEIGVVLDGQRFTKELSVGSRVVRVSPERPDHSLLAQLTWPVEPPLPEGAPIRLVAVAYPPRELALLGAWEYGWMVAFTVLSVAFAFALRKPLGVTI
jgi:hypothetical protein